MLVQFLWYSQSILIPFIFAVLIWNLLSTGALFLQKTPFFGEYLSRSFALCVALLVLMGFGFYFVKMLSVNMQDMLSSSAEVQKKWIVWMSGWSTKSAMIESIFKQVNVQALLLGFYSAISNFMSSMLLMMLFVIFFFIEGTYFHDKLTLIFTEPKKYQKVTYLMTTIPNRIQFYLGLKTLFSFITATLIYLIMHLMGLNYASFWAASIFLLNFIPNVGPVVVTLVLSIFAYCQWLLPMKVFLFLILQVLVHMIVGNFVETHYLGKSLHLSPLVIILSLCFWGMLWGGTGLFLAVPMTVLMMIIFSCFRPLRPFAIFMSENGELLDDLE